MEQQGYEEPTGQAKITPAFNLPCNYVIHTVGPIVRGELTQQHCELLKSCYRSCLELADESTHPSLSGTTGLGKGQRLFCVDHECGSSIPAGRV